MEQYLILNKNMPLTPLSVFDKNWNVQIIELSLEDAKRYVEEQNQKCGEDLFFYMEIKEWLKLRESPQVVELQDKLHEEVAKLLDCPEINEICKRICEETDKNINGFMIPFEADNNEDYEKKLKDELEGFIKEIDRPAFRKEGSLVDDVKVICKKVIEAFDAAKIGDIKKAEKIIEEILEEYKKFPFAVSELDKSYAFRGIAPFDDLQQKWVAKEEYETMMDGELNFFRARSMEKTKTIQTEDAINYLSYSKSGLAKDLRFSSKGKVCLYLGTTSYVCCKECRWNGEDNLYLASFKFNKKGKKLKILNLVVTQSLLNGTIPMPGDTIYYRKLHNAMIRVFPLVIATMFTIKTSDEVRKKSYGEKNKYEYLLSQVLMNVLQKVEIDGVAYLSRQGKDDFQYPQMICLAIPINDISEDDEYGELINFFVMTPPVLYNGFSDDSTYERRSYINEKYPNYVDYSWGQKENFNAKVEYNGEIVFYEDIPYSKFDDYLVNQEHKKFVVS